MTSVAPRHPDHVMKLARMGAAHPTRLSFMRSLLRMLRREHWTFERVHWDLDDVGVGTAVYCAVGPERTYSLVAFGHDLDDEQRSDRVIATAWDSTFTLFDGVPTAADLERLRAEVPYQEAGRVGETELTLSRANRSVRMFTHVVDRLADGQQPDQELIDQVGYLMRTTAVYGSGKFGAADRGRLLERPECLPSFRIEMLSVWLIRQYTTDLVEHLAARRAPSTAVRLDAALRRSFGVGNSTGLGMAPFLANHPALLHTWVDAKEQALARVRSAPLRPADRALISTLHERAEIAVAGWYTDDVRQAEAIDGLRNDLDRLREHLASPWRDWDELYTWAERELTLEGQELVVSLLIECRGDLVDELADTLYVDEDECFPIDGAMTVAALRGIIETVYSWALDPDYGTEHDSARFWYTSEEKLEPRLGQRYEEPGADLELPLAVGRDIASLHRLLHDHSSTASAATLLAAHPDVRHVVRRVQIAADRPYAEIRDNTISAELRAVDLLRYKLAYFGASRFDPRSDRWTRITMFQHAPYPDEFASIDADDWAYPTLGAPQASQRDARWEATASLEPGRPVPTPTSVACSLAELGALSRKAARGAGATWGEADDIAKAIIWIAARDTDRVAAIVTALDALDAQGRSADNPVLAAIALADTSKRAVGEHVAPELAHRTPTHGHVHLPERVWDRLGEFAWRTYVPETEQGRLQGAGAGLTDND